MRETLLPCNLLYPVNALFHHVYVLIFFLIIVFDLNMFRLSCFPLFSTSPQDIYAKDGAK